MYIVYMYSEKPEHNATCSRGCKRLRPKIDLLAIPPRYR